MWEVNSGKLIIELREHQASIASLCFKESDTNILASGSSDTTIRIWNLKYGRSLCVLAGHKAAVTSICFNLNDSNILASGSRDKTIRIWNIQLMQQISIILGHVEEVLSVSFNQYNQLASSSYDQSVKVWEITPTSNGLRWCLKWTSQPKLFCKNCQVDGAEITPSYNRIILSQRGAKGKPLEIETPKNFPSPIALQLSKFRKPFVEDLKELEQPTNLSTLVRK